MKRLLTILLISTLSLVTLNSCKNGIEPEDHFKNPNEMTWKCDTLMYPNSLQTMLVSLYVSAPGNVWATGHCNLGGDGMLWRYNGSLWTPYSIFNDIPRAPIGLNKLSGLNSNEIWLAGNRLVSGSGDNRIYSPLLLMYENGLWIEHKPLVNNANTRILSISGNSSNDFWLGGDNGILIHNYYGRWTCDTLKIKLPKTTSCGIGSIVMFKNKPFVMLTLNDAALHYIKTYYFTGTEKNWQLVDSSIITQTSYYENGGDEELYVSNSGRLFSYGTHGIWEWIDNKWIQTLRLNDNSIYGIYDAGDDCIYAVGDICYFYDGSTWNELKFLAGKNGEPINYTDLWTNGKETFVLGYKAGGSPNMTYIWHGK